MVNWALSSLNRGSLENTVRGPSRCNRQNFSGDVLYQTYGTLLSLLVRNKRYETPCSTCNSISPTKIKEIELFSQTLISKSLYL